MPELRKDVDGKLNDNVNKPGMRAVYVTNRQNGGGKKMPYQN